MSTKKNFIEKEKQIWHKHFAPSLVAGIAVGIIAFLLEATVSNIVLFASIGASASILTNSRSHHLTKLHTTITAYIIAIIIATIIFLINTQITLHISINIFLSVFLVGLSLFLFNSFHPPAISAALSFIILNRPVTSLIYLMIIVIALFIIIRLITYVISQNLSIKEFFKEFTRSFS